MVGGVVASPGSAFNVQDIRRQRLADSIELANAARLAGVTGNNQTVNALSTALLLHQLLNTSLLSPAIRDFPPSFLLSPTVLQFFFIRNLTINVFDSTPNLATQITAQKVLLRVTGSGLGAVPIVDFLA